MYTRSWWYICWWLRAEYKFSFVWYHLNTFSAFPAIIYKEYEIGKQLIECSWLISWFVPVRILVIWGIYLIFCATMGVRGWYLPPVFFGCRWHRWRPPGAGLNLYPSLCFLYFHARTCICRWFGMAHNRPLTVGKTRLIIFMFYLISFSWPLAAVYWSLLLFRDATSLCLWCSLVSHHN